MAEEKWGFLASAIGIPVVAITVWKLLGGSSSGIKIEPSHDWFYAEVEGKYYLGRPEYDALVFPKEWVEEMLQVQRMTPKEFFEKYGRREITGERLKEVLERYKPRFWTREELEEVAGLLRFTHGEEGR